MVLFAGQRSCREILPDLNFSTDRICSGSTPGVVHFAIEKQNRGLNCELSHNSHCAPAHNLAVSIKLSAHGGNESVYEGAGTAMIVCLSCFVATASGEYLLEIVVLGYRIKTRKEYSRGSLRRPKSVKDPESV